MSELKPCPFCGETPVVYPLDPENEGDAWTKIACISWACAVNPFVQKNAESGHFEMASEAWNTRANIPKAKLPDYGDGPEPCEDCSKAQARIEVLEEQVRRKDAMTKEAMRIVSFWSEQKLRKEIHPDLQDGDYEFAYESFIKECRAVFSPLGRWKPGDATRIQQELDKDGADDE